jgi:hypothetical protein
LQGKEEAPEATTNQTIEVTKEAPAAEEKPDGTKISVMGLMSALKWNNSTSVNVSGKAKVEIKE